MEHEEDEYSEEELAQTVTLTFTLEEVLGIRTVMGSQLRRKKKDIVAASKKGLPQNILDKILHRITKYTSIITKVDRDLDAAGF